MYNDEHKAIIEPRKGRSEQSLPSSAVVIFTPQDLDLFIKCFPEPPVKSRRIFLADVYTCSHQGGSFALVGPMLGAPQSVMILERLIALGVRDVFAIGWCGSLQTHVQIGDVVLPTGALSEEGTSRHYPIGEENPGPSVDLLAVLRSALCTEGLKIHEGTVWSTDAPFREIVGKVLAYQKQGVLGVEMETSAMFTVARFRGIRLAVALIASDELATLKWVHGFRSPAFKKGREKLIELTLRVVCSTLQAATGQ